MTTRVDYPEHPGGRSVRALDLSGDKVFQFRLTRDARDSDGWKLLIGNRLHAEAVPLTTDAVRRLLQEAAGKVPADGEQVMVQVGSITVTVDKAQWCRMQDYLSMFGEV